MWNNKSGTENLENKIQLWTMLKVLACLRKFPKESYFLLKGAYLK